MLDILFELTGLTEFTQLHTFVIAIISTKIIAYAKKFHSKVFSPSYFYNRIVYEKLFDV